MLQESEEGELEQLDPGRSLPGGRELGMAQKEELDLNGRRAGGPEGGAVTSKGREAG